jgi:hypothetical protein
LTAQSYKCCRYLVFKDQKRYSPNLINSSNQGRLSSCCCQMYRGTSPPALIASNSREIYSYRRIMSRDFLGKNEGGMMKVECRMKSH